MGIEFDGYEAVQERFANMEEELSNKNEFREEGALIVVAAAQDAFRGNPLGWKPNDPDTIRQKGNSDPGIGVTRKLHSTLEPVIGADFVGVRYKQYYGRFFDKVRPMVFTQRALAILHEFNVKIHSWKSAK